MKTYEELTEAIAAFGHTSPDVKAIVLIGSRAGKNADEYSDMDLMLVVRDPAYFQRTNCWITGIGPFWISFYEDTLGGGKEVRVLFENALDVDFMFFTKEQFETVIDETPAIFDRGFLVWLDKDGAASALQRLPAKHREYAPAEAGEFVNLVQDFWFHSVWAAKKLKRGELWAAKSCVDGYMKGRLIKVVEWHAHANNGPEFETRPGGRFLDTWADPAALNGLRAAFAHYCKKDVVRALFATMDVFRLLAIETAEKWGFAYPLAADEKATQWVKEFLKADG